MNRIIAVLEAHADGTLHLPLPEELRTGKIEITATLRAAPDPSSKSDSDSIPSLLRATPEMLQRRRDALAALREMGGLSDLIPDPAIWQREMRADRPLPGLD